MAEQSLLDPLGDTVVMVTSVPAAFAVTMGNTAYLLRHRQLKPLLDAIRKVQQPSHPSNEIIHPDTTEKLHHRAPSACHYGFVHPAGLALALHKQGGTLPRPASLVH